MKISVAMFSIITLPGAQGVGVCEGVGWSRVRSGQGLRCPKEGSLSRGPATSPHRPCLEEAPLQCSRPSWYAGGCRCCQSAGHLQGQRGDKQHKDSPCEVGNRLTRPMRRTCALATALLLAHCSWPSPGSVMTTAGCSPFWMSSIIGAFHSSPNPSSEQCRTMKGSLVPGQAQA